TCKKAFTQLSEAMSHVSVIKNVEHRMQPQMSIHERNASLYAEKAEAQQQLVVTAANQVKEEQRLFESDALKNNKKDLQAMAVRMRGAVDVIRAATKDAGQQYQQAYQATKDSGEVGFFASLTAIIGPTVIASNRAREVWEQTKTVEKE